MQLSKQKRITGNAAVAVFSRASQFATLTSQLIACAEDGRLSVTYYSSEGATLSICADDHCVPQRKPFGELSVNLSSTQPFRLRVVGESQKESFVIVKKISSSGGFCRLQSPTELACKALSCTFKGMSCVAYSVQLKRYRPSAEILRVRHYRDPTYVYLSGQ